MFFKKYKKIILIISIAIVLFFVYSYFTGGKEDEALLKSSVHAKTGAEAIGTEIVQALNQIETLQLDKTIFSDPVYTSLTDRSQVLTPEPVGRDNPFSPIGASVSNQATIEIPQTPRVPQVQPGTVNNTPTR